MEQLSRHIMKLSSARAWRTYTGGKLLDEMSKKADAEDSNFPEEWIMSVVRAFNAGREEICEGMSMVESEESQVSLKEVLEASPEEMLGRVHVDKYGATPGVLAKMIDSAERLTIQVHPDKKDAKRLFNSDFGKTECWYCVGGRIVDGQKPCIYLGFREGITKEYWKTLFEKQDIDGMLACLHRFEISQGDVFLIEGGIPHAIGAGCLLVEIQEPTDYTIRVERVTPSGLKVADAMCHQGIGFEKMMECFKYTGYSREEIIRRWMVKPKILEKYPQVTELIGYKQTPCFRMECLDLKPGENFAMEEKTFFGIYILEGRGKFGCAEESQGFRKTDQFFVPASAKTVSVKAETSVKILKIYGPGL